jgi:hypothetical protein
VGDDGTSTVKSGASTQLGCYEPVPVVSVDGASPAATATVAVGNPFTVVNVGVDPVQHAQTAQAAKHIQRSSTGLWTTVAIVGAGELVTVVVVLLWARRQRAGAEAGP